MLDAEQLLYQSEKSSYQRFSVKTMFLKNLVQMLSIDLTPTPSCERRFCMFIINGY